jgi:hypothetical protein
MNPAAITILALSLTFLVLMITIALWVRRVLRRATQGQGQGDSVTHGEPGAQLVTKLSEARILELSRGKLTVSQGGQRWLQLVLDLEVEPDFGAAFTSRATIMASELQIPMLQPGTRLRVRHGEGASGGTSMSVDAVWQDSLGDWVPFDTSAPMGVGKTATKAAMVIVIFAVLIALLGGGLVTFLAVGAAEQDQMATARDRNDVCSQTQRCCLILGNPRPKCDFYLGADIPTRSCENMLKLLKKKATKQGLDCP